jgi:mRNA interferase MazF
MRCSRGDVVLVLFPDSNLRTARYRPAVVVQAERLETGLEQTIVAMVTSNMDRTGHPSRVAVSSGSALGKEMGLLTDSVIMTDNLATIRDTEIARTIGNCRQMAPVDAALRRTLGLA